MISFIFREFDIKERLACLSLEWRRIASGMFWIILFILLGKIIGAAKEMSIAWHYGTDEIVDAYLFVFSLLSWPLSIWLSVLTVVLVPLLARMRANTPEEIPFFYSELLGFTLVIALLFMVSCYLFFGVIFKTQELGFSEHTKEIAKEMANKLIYLAPLGAVISLFSVWLLAVGRHQNTLYEAIPAFILCLAIVCFSNLQLEPLVWGTVVGYVVHLLALSISLHRSGELPVPRFTFKCAFWGELGKGIGIITLGQALIALGPIIDQFFAANLGSGSIASLGYANRVLALILSLAALSISRATLPVFSSEFAGSNRSVRSLALRWVFIIFGGSVVIVFFSWIAAHKIVSILFERGAFNANNTSIVTYLFQRGLLQLPLYASSLVLVSYFASSRKYFLIFISGILGLLSKVAANYLLIPAFGMTGVMYSYSVVYGINLIFFSLMFLAEERHLKIGLRSYFMSRQP